jgi:hypothetical protein
MNISSRWSFRSIVGKSMMGLVSVVMMSSIGVAPSFGNDGHNHGGMHDSGGRNVNRRQGHDENRGRGHDRYRRVYRPHGYGEGVYVPPPVVYEPPPPPGISIFIPPIIIR